MLKLRHTYRFKNYVVAMTILVFIAANVGLAVFTHSCSISGVEKTFYIELADPCSSDHPVAPKSCCAVPQTEEVHFENSCCSTETNYVALDTDTRVEYLESFFLSLNVNEVALSSFYHFYSPNTATDEFVCQAGNLPPPKYQGRDLQSIFQVYTI